ncbi:hypothetical protein [Chryseobacterium sp. MYb328]|uniref:hypothetical protein n=1 Tax=Chryseobacterium sp. MYb328 TaxID=2745231 RepID=UPI0030A1D669
MNNSELFPPSFDKKKIIKEEYQKWQHDKKDLDFAIRNDGWMIFKKTHLKRADKINLDIKEDGDLFWLRPKTLTQRLSELNE